MNVQKTQASNASITSLLQRAQPLMTSTVEQNNTKQSTVTGETFGLDPHSQVDEESFQHALVQYVLEDLNAEAASYYSVAFEKIRNAGVPVEDAVKLSLKQVVAEGKLSQSDAERINGITFRAAQLDDKLDTLYDGRGGPNDPTVAVATARDAATKAREVFRAAEAGEISLHARSLDAPSNLAPGSTPPMASAIGHTSSGSNEFLWKPQSESNGRLVVLLPAEYTGKVVSAGIYSDVPPTRANRIEEGSFSGDTHNGGRAHFRFSKAGGSYPDGVFVVATLRDGRTVSFPIRDSAARNTR